MKFLKNIFVVIIICLVLVFGIIGKIFLDKIGDLNEKLLLATSKNVRLSKTNKSLKAKNTKLTKTNKTLRSKNTKLAKKNRVFAQNRLKNKKRLRAYRRKLVFTKKSALKKLIPKASSKSIPFIGSVVTASFVATEMQQLCDDVMDAKKLETDLYGDSNESNGIETFCNQMTIKGIKNTYDDFTNAIKRETRYTIDFWKYEYHKMFP